MSSSSSVSGPPSAIDDTFRARGAIAQLFRSDALEIVVGGPAGTGKTRGLLEYLNYMASAHDNCRLSLLRKTRRSLTESAMVTFEQKVLHPAQGVRWESAVQRYHYPNGSILAVGGLDKPSKVMSSEWDIIAVPEATELLEGEWEALTTRLRNGRTPRQQIIGDCNPDAPWHWIRQRAATGKLLLMDSHYEDNPSWWQDGRWTKAGIDYLAKLDELTGVRKRRLRYGEWAAAEGMVYQDSWDRARCLLPRTRYCRQYANLRGDCGIDPTWPRYLGIDWGYRNPTAVKWYVRMPDGQLLVYREIYQTVTLVEDIARSALSVMGWELATGGVLKPTRGDADPLPREIIADHDAEDRATFERYFGMSVYPADKGKDSINIGIQYVSKRLQEGRLLYLEGSLVQRDPLLEAAKKPCSSLEEFESYIWDTRAGRKPKEIPIDDNNHGMDVDRYVCLYFDHQPTSVGRAIQFSAAGLS
jgi:hypothetical protein